MRLSPSPRLAAAAFGVLLLACLACAQSQDASVAVPHEVGKLVPASDWVVLRAPELQMASRATDPSEDPARELLLSYCKQLTDRALAQDRVVLHHAGANPTQLRLISAHAIERRVSATELIEPTTIATFRSEFETALASSHSTIEFVEERVLDLFTDVACLSLTLRTSNGSDSWLRTCYFVPSGQRLTYFETAHAPADVEARAAIEAVLRTFNGAVDPDAAGRLLRTMTIGGITGGIGGVLAALLRRKRRQRLLELQREQDA